MSSRRTLRPFLDGPFLFLASAEMIEGTDESHVMSSAEGPFTPVASSPDHVFLTMSLPTVASLPCE